MSDPGQDHTQYPVAAGRSSPDALTLRVATPDDLPSVVRLAALDSSRPPRPPLLIAEIGSEILVAVSMADGKAIADPFRRTADVEAIARLRARGGAAA